MSRKVFGLIVLVFVVCCNVGAKEFQFFNITPEDGLEETSINIVYQDYEGYVWIGTIDGLYKYDGYNLSSYKKINVDINSLSSSNISFIYEDKDKQLWVGTDAGLNVYNRTLDNFEQITLIDSSKKEVKIRIFDMLESEDDQLWAISNTGVYIIDNLTHVVKKPFHGFYGNNEILICQGVSKDANGNLYFAYVHPEKGGVLKYNLKTQAIDRIDSNHPNIKIKAKNITCITIDSKNRLWIGYFTDGAEVIDINTNKVVNFENIAGDEHSLSHNFVHNITEDNLGDIFIGTDNGLNYLEKDSKDIVKVLASSSNTSLLTNIINGKPYCSVDNSIWFPCKGGGVSVYDSRLVKFKTYKSRTDNDNSIIINQVLAFTEDTDHRVWFSSDGYGITSFNPETQLFNTYLHEDGDSLSLTNNKVLALKADHNNGMWAGMWQGGLCYFQIEDDGLTLKNKYLFLGEDSTKHSSIYKLYQTKNNDLWVGSFGEGVFKYLPEEDRFKQYRFDTLFDFRAVYAICEDYLGNMWFGVTDRGIVLYNEAKNEIENIVFQEDNKDGLPAPSVYVIMEDTHNRLWVGTRGGGLSLFNHETRVWTTFTKDDGLPSNKVVGIQEDDNGDVWLSTNHGLSKMQLEEVDGKLKPTFTNFTYKDGLQSNTFNAWSYFKSADGTLYFGGKNGFNAFLPESISKNLIPPPIYLTDLLLFNKKAVIGEENSPLIKHISQMDQLVLNYEQSIFTLRYNAINFIQNEKCNYAYMLEGFEDKWNYVGQQRMATYTNIPAGKYVFKVKASNNDGIWNETGIQIAIVILPAWWQAIWFKILGIVIALIVLVAFYYYRLNALNVQKNKLGVAVKERTIALNKAYEDLEHKQKEIKIQNDNLLSSEEELQQINEELYTSNDQLFVQKNDLENTIRLLKDAQQKMIRQEKMASVGILTSGIAHEINNPLNFIQGGKTALELYVYDHLKDHEKGIKPFIQMIEEGIDRASSIIQGLNRFNRKTDDYEEDCDMHFILDNCLLMLQNTTKYAIEIIKDFSSESVLVKGNEGELHQVFINILSNAIQAMEGKGIININTQISNNNINIQIKDSGKGINPEELKKVMDPFYTTKAPGEGTGLGMSIAYSILQKHKANIIYDSVLGEGTTVEVNIPLNS